MSYLTNKQEAFVQQYMIDRNATQAAIRAGYNPNTARVTACKMLTKANIQSRLGELERNAHAFAEKTADDVRAKLISVAWSENPKISIRDKLKALELYAKYIGMDREAKKENLPTFNITMVMDGKRRVDKKPKALPAAIKT